MDNKKILSFIFSLVGTTVLLYARAPWQQSENQSVLNQNPEDFEDIELFAKNNYTATSGTNNNNKKNKLISFSFKDTPLSEIVDLIGSETDINIIYPQNPADSATFAEQKITFRPDIPEKIPLNEAWKLLRFFLEMSDFSIFKKEPKLYVIIKTGKKDEPGIVRQPLPLYIDTKPEDLPHSTEYIRYIHYLNNLQVPKQNEASESPINSIITDMQSPGAAEPLYLHRPNGFVLVDESNRIASIVNIINTLDETGYKEAVKVLQLHSIPATDAVKVFDLLKAAAGKAETPSPFIRRRTGSQGPGYFASETTIIADPRTNSVILMGRESALLLIEEFIINHMDVPPESGDSILHYYELQYLKAGDFANILSEIVKRDAGRQAEEEVGGPSRFFQGVIIQAEEREAIKPPEALQSTTEIELIEGMRQPGIQGEAFMGGNRLIIAAYQDDWERLKDIIQQVDRLEPQVILEVSIVDVTHNRNKLLQAAVRNKDHLKDVNRSIEALATHLAAINNEYGPGVNDIPTQPKRLDDDLLKLTSNRSTDNNLSVPQLFSTGATLISVNDCFTPGVFGLIAALDQYADTRVLSHPYVVATNHQRATIANAVQKRVRGDALPSQSGVVTIKIDSIYATLQVQFIPHIVSENRLSLQVAVDVNEFIGTTNDRTTRRVETNANLDTREVLVIGGLTRVRQEETRTITPILGQIPIIGTFFQGTVKRVIGSNLAIFISPTIVYPKYTSGLNLYTEDKLRKSRRDLSDHILYNHKDPVTRLFFPETRAANNDLIEEYILQSKNAPTMEAVKTTRERRLEKIYPATRRKPRYQDPRKKRPKRRKKRKVVAPLVV